MQNICHKKYSQKNEGGGEEEERERGGALVLALALVLLALQEIQQNHHSPHKHKKNKVPKHISKKCMQKNGVGSGVLGCYSTMAVALWVAQK